MALLTKKQERILKRLKKVTEELSKSMVDLQIENLNGQFDMTNCSELGITTDTIQTLANKISDICDQRTKRG